MAAAAVAETVHAHGAMPVPLALVDRLLDSQLSGATAVAAGDPSTWPSIAEEMKALGSGDLQAMPAAYNRLVARGAAVAPRIAERLSDSSAGLLQRKWLLNILGHLAVPGTESAVIGFTEELRGLDEKTRQLSLKTLYRQTFDALSRFPDPGAGIGYADELLGNPATDPVVRAQALIFLGRHKIARAQRWLDAYRDDDSVDIRFARLYLGGRLGIGAFTQETIEFLRNAPVSNTRRSQEIGLLLDNLMHSVSPDELAGIIDAVRARDARLNTDDRINTLPRLARLYRGDAGQRSVAALELLRNWNRDSAATLVSLQFMVEINDAAPYLPAWKRHHPVLTRYLDHLGYRIDARAKSPGFVRTTGSNGDRLPRTDALVQGLLASLRDNDVESFKASSLADSMTMAQIGGLPQGSTDDPYAGYLAGAVSAWHALHSKAAAGGTDWRSIGYRSHGEEVLVGIDGTLIATVRIQIEANGQPHTIVLENCMLFDNSWYLMSGIRWL